jgi:hypothetical protein
LAYDKALNALPSHPVPAGGGQAALIPHEPSPVLDNRVV